MVDAVTNAAAEPTAGEERQAQADEMMQALLSFHPEAEQRSELRVAKVAQATIDSLYPLNADFFLECIGGYLSAGGRFVALEDENHHRADRLEFVTWGTYQPNDPDGALMWWSKSEKPQFERVIYQIFEADELAKDAVAQRLTVITTTMGVLARTFRYILKIKASNDPTRPRNAMVHIFSMVLPDLLESSLKVKSAS